MQPQKSLQKRKWLKREQLQKLQRKKSKVFLHHIGIESKNPEKIARFYSKTMKMNIIVELEVMD